MRYLKRFNEHSNPTIYTTDWRKFVPDSLVVIKGDCTDINGWIIDPKTKKPTNQQLRYKLGNIMSDLVHQVTYDNDFEFLGLPDTLEMDVAMIKDENESHFQMNVEITFGDLVAAGFIIEPPNKVTPYFYTSYHSVTDPSETVFAFDEESIQKLLKFFNRFEGIKIERKDLNFLDNNPDNYYPPSNILPSVTSN